MEKLTNIDMRRTKKFAKCLVAIFSVVAVSSFFLGFNLLFWVSLVIIGTSILVPIIIMYFQYREVKSMMEEEWMNMIEGEFGGEEPDEK